MIAWVQFGRGVGCILAGNRTIPKFFVGLTARVVETESLDNAAKSPCPRDGYPEANMDAGTT